MNMIGRSFVGAGLALLVTSWAVPSSAAIISKTKFKSESVNASFFESTPITCDDGSLGSVDTSVFVGAFEQVVKSTLSIPSTSEAFASFFQFNTCTGTSVSAFQNVPNPDYEQTGTNSATLNVTFELVDSTTGTFLGFLDVGLVFTGVGTTTRQNSHSITQSGDFVFKFRSIGEFRNAAVSGAITFNGENLVDGVQFAQLSDVSSGDMTVQR
jgi:hypothetical protein